MYRIVDTDNFGGDYPDEKFVEGGEYETEEEAQWVATSMNNVTGPHALRYYKVVELPYELQPGFEP